MLNYIDCDKCMMHTCMIIHVRIIIVQELQEAIVYVAKMLYTKPCLSADKQFNLYLLYDITCSVFMLCCLV